MLPHHPDDKQYDAADAGALTVPEIPVQGTVELDLDDLNYGRCRSPDGMVVRVRLGSEKWLSVSQERLARATHGARAVEITGSEPLAVAEAVAFVHRRHGEWAQADREAVALLAAREATR